MQAKPDKYAVVVLGGGAAGFFYAINLAMQCPHVQITILEQGRQLLSKVRISGGGRCNVTHACFDPKELIQYYPRGGRELLSAFHRFQPVDTIAWFEKQGVELHTESDGRMFPVSNDSATIVQCFLQLAKRLHIQVETAQRITAIRSANTKWEIHAEGQKPIAADIVFLGTGSSASGWKMARELGHTISPPVPSLFTFNIRDPLLKDLQGISFTQTTVRLEGSEHVSEGPLLITHWGLSGPAVLKLSAFAAKEIATRNYITKVLVDFIPEVTLQELETRLLSTKRDHPTKKIVNHPQFELPDRFWRQLCAVCGIPENCNWSDVRSAQLKTLMQTLKSGSLAMHGKSTFKEEFVTCGGVDLKEVDMRTMESKLNKGLYFGGEVLDIDAVTGGFNFQAAWTTAFIAANDSAIKLNQHLQV